MGRWRIGPIVGQFQPEDFTEKQGVVYEEPDVFGFVPPLIFKRWDPREVTLSFVVNALGISREEVVVNEAIPNAPNQTDPEVVWATLCAMMRPGNGRLPSVLGGTDPERDFPRVVIPGWGVGGNTPTRAIVKSASIKRTHITGDPSRAIRAIITVTLQEFSNPTGTARGFSEQEAGRATVTDKETGEKSSVPGGLGVVYDPSEFIQ